MPGRDCVDGGLGEAIEFLEHLDVVDRAGFGDGGLNDDDTLGAFFARFLCVLRGRFDDGPRRNDVTTNMVGTIGLGGLSPTSATVAGSITRKR